MAVRDGGRSPKVCVCHRSGRLPSSPRLAVVVVGYGDDDSDAGMNGPGDKGAAEHEQPTLAEDPGGA
jgi:hypothetical protein